MKSFAHFPFSAFVTLLAVWLLVSCKNEVSVVAPQTQTNAGNYEPRGTRIAFKDATAFMKAVKELQQYRTSEERAVWEGRYKFTSLRKYNEEHPLARHLADMKVPVTYTSLLNEDGEFIIGHEIIWFDKGYNYFIPEEDAKLLATVKQNPASYTNRHKIISEVLGKSSSNLRTDGAILTTGDPDARYQKIWAVNGETGPWRKTVYEITANRVYAGFDDVNHENLYNFTFDMYIKLEWWSPRHGWQINAGEERHVSYDITGIAITNGTPYAYSYPISVSLNPPSNPFQSYSSSDYQQQLASGALVGESYGSVTYQLQGNIDTFVRMNNVVQTESYYSVSGNLWE